MAANLIVKCFPVGLRKKKSMDGLGRTGSFAFYLSAGALAGSRRRPPTRTARAPDRRLGAISGSSAPKVLTASGGVERWCGLSSFLPFKIFRAWLGSCSTGATGAVTRRLGRRGDVAYLDHLGACGSAALDQALPVGRDEPPPPSPASARCIDGGVVSSDAASARPNRGAGALVSRLLPLSARGRDDRQHARGSRFPVTWRRATMDWAGHAGGRPERAAGGRTTGSSRLAR